MLHVILSTIAFFGLAAAQPAGNAALKCRAANVGEHESREVHSPSFAARHFSAASGQTAPSDPGVVFLVRHAERADAGMASAKMAGADPELSDAGKARAASLAALLKDAKITAIFTTEYKRTRDTAQPLAAATGITAAAVDSKDAVSLIDRVKASAGNVLVVGHSNTLPDIIKALGIGEPVSIADDQFDNLFVVVRGARPALLRLHYR